MNGTTNASNISLNDCGCCEGLAASTPVDIDNRAGLASIAYRVGTHAEFLKNMLAKLSSQGLLPLAALRTRDADDFSIALLDAWATVADVLTFYQERIANESFLRTATERRSLLDQARLIGYELRPGVAASTFLAFRMDEAPGSPLRTTIDQGAKVQSIPGPGEKPQTYETREPIEARVEWNAMRPQMTSFKLPRFNDTFLYLRGTTTNLKPGDMILLVGNEREGNPLDDHWDGRLVQTVEPDFAADRTRVTWERGLGSRVPSNRPAANPRIFAFRQRAALFGHNAQPWNTLPISLRVGERNPQPALRGRSPFLAGEFAALEHAWSDAKLSNDTERINLDATYNQVTVGSWIVLSTATPRDYVELYRVKAVADETKSAFNLTAKSTRLDISGENINRFSPRGTVVFAQSEELKLAESPLVEFVGGNEIVLDRVVHDLAPMQTLIVRGKQARVRVIDRSAGLPLVRDGKPIGTVKRGDQLLVLTTPTLVEGQKDLKRWHLRDLRGAEGFVDDPDEQIVPAAPADDDPFVSELATLVQAKSADPDHTLLRLRRPLANLFDRTTVTINANVARASHGEAATEILGNGEARQPFQRFVLRQPPLTHVSASNSSGAESTLRVYVNDLEWHEVQSLYGRKPNERVFVTRTSEEGKTTVAFGDGRTGARLPSGQENVRATYRKGIGLEGLVKAEQLSLLMTRPLGVKSVVNPLPTNGAADRESLNDARVNAPLTVLTLDRIVSLQDYEDFARAYAGIAKTLATRTRDSGTHGVFLTVAGPNGAQVEPGSDLYGHLLEALVKAGNPFVPIRVRSYRKAMFKVMGSFRVDPDRIPEKVKTAVDDALLWHFSFDARKFGQSVPKSEVIAVIQNVPGVSMVDIDNLRRTTGVGDGAVNDRLLAAMPDGDLAAELLTLDPAHLDELKVTT